MALEDSLANDPEMIDKLFRCAKAIAKHVLVVSLPLIVILSLDCW